MKIQNAFISCAALLVALFAQSNPAVLAQTDVAAAARANRANHAKTESAKADSAWYSPTRVTLRAQDHSDTSTIIYEIAPNQDLRITMDATERGKRQTGQIMVINGQRQWMLAKNLPLEKGYEIDALDVPVLSLKLVLELLRAAAPGGPSQIKEKTTFNVKEGIRSIEVSTVSANGGLEAPWTLQATIEPTAPDQSSFELTAKHKETVHLTGTWQKEATPPAFGDDMPLDGWQILSIGPIKTTDGNSTILDYGAQVSRQQAKTLGELRRMTKD
jgi:hypothetical protein